MDYFSWNQHKLWSMWYTVVHRTLNNPKLVLKENRCMHCARQYIPHTIYGSSSMLIVHSSMQLFGVYVFWWLCMCAWSQPSIVLAMKLWAKDSRSKIEAKNFDLNSHFAERSKCHQKSSSARLNGCFCFSFILCAAW